MDGYASMRAGQPTEENKAEGRVSPHLGSIALAFSLGIFVAGTWILLTDLKTEIAEVRTEMRTDLQLIEGRLEGLTLELQEIKVRLIESNED